MQIELKNLRHYPRLSKESQAFSATIFIDGLSVGTARNAGDGSETTYEFINTSIQQRFEDHCRSLPPETTEFGVLPMTPDLFLGLLCDAYNRKRWVNRAVKKNVVFRVEGDPKNEYRSVNVRRHKDRDEVELQARQKIVRHIQQQYGSSVVELHGAGDDPQ